MLLESELRELCDIYVEYINTINTNKFAHKKGGASDYMIDDESYNSITSLYSIVVNRISSVLTNEYRKKEYIDSEYIKINSKHVSSYLNLRDGTQSLLNEKMLTDREIKDGVQMLNNNGYIELWDIPIVKYTRYIYSSYINTYNMYFDGLVQDIVDIENTMHDNKQYPSQATNLVTGLFERLLSLLEDYPLFDIQLLAFRYQDDLIKSFDFTIDGIKQNLSNDELHKLVPKLNSYLLIYAIFGDIWYWEPFYKTLFRTHDDRPIKIDYTGN